MYEEIPEDNYMYMQPMPNSRAPQPLASRAPQPPASRVRPSPAPQVSCDICAFLCLFGQVKIIDRMICHIEIITIFSACLQ